MPTPETGKTAPDFVLASHQGGNVTLSALRGHPVVLYFYPKDNTPGCTLEARQFQSRLPQFEKLGAVVLGISPDPLSAHCKFAGKFGLRFLLLADEDHAVADRYGAWGEKSMYGKKYMGILRSTFLIGPDGILRQTWPKVKPEGHAAEVLESVKRLD